MAGATAVGIFADASDLLVDGSFVFDTSPDATGRWGRAIHTQNSTTTVRHAYLSGSSDASIFLLNPKGGSIQGVVIDITGAGIVGTGDGIAVSGGTAGTAANAFIGYEDLIDLKFSAAAPYRMVGVWVMANSAIKIAKKFKDGQGQYLWQPAISLGMPDMFDGNPVYEDPYLATVASASKSVLFGDPAAVLIKQLPLRVATSESSCWSWVTMMTVPS